MQQRPSNLAEYFRVSLSDSKHTQYSSDHSPIPSVGLSVGLSVKCTVAKQLIGSKCHLYRDGEWGQLRYGCIRWGGDR